MARRLDDTRLRTREGRYVAECSFCMCPDGCACGVDGCPCGTAKPRGLGRMLRSSRQTVGMTMGDVARALGVDVPTVSNIELGRAGDRILSDRFVQVLRERGLDSDFALAVEACAAKVSWPTRLPSEGNERG